MTQVISGDFSVEEVTSLALVKFRLSRFSTRKHQLLEILERRIKQQCQGDRGQYNGNEFICIKLKQSSFYTIVIKVDQNRVTICEKKL